MVKRVLFYSLLCVIVIIVIFPFLWTLYASFINSDLDVNKFSLDLSKYGLGNYTHIIKSNYLIIWYKNSIIVTGVITICGLFFNTMAGYSLARVKIPGQRILFLLTLGIMMIPPQILLIPTYILMIKFGWINTYLALIVPFMVNPFGVFLMRQFYINFPKELEDAAKIDGLSRIGIFFRIALPLSKAGLAAQAIIIFIWNWNSFMFPSVLVTDPKYYTLPLGIYQITRNTFVSSITKSMAGVVFMTIPVLIVFILFQRFFIRGISETGIK